MTDAVAGIGRVAAPPGHRSIAVRWARIAAWHHLERNPPDDLDPWSRGNLRHFVAWENRVAELLAGDRLLHTDLHSLNILVGDTARIIDWAWWRTGAPFVDVGFLVLRLIEAGHTPAEAERVADAVPAWADAPGDARTGFAVAALGIWEQLQRDDPLPMRPAWTATARRWARHRLDG